MGYFKINGYLILIFILLHHTQPYRVRRAHLDQQQQDPGKNQVYQNPVLQNRQPPGIQFQNRSSNFRVIQGQRARNGLRRQYWGQNSGRSLNYRAHQLPAGPAGSVPRTRFAPSGQAIPQERSHSNGILIRAGPDGGYSNLQIAIDDKVEKNYIIIEKLFDLLADVSKMLHKTTGKRLYFKHVNILIPKSWGPSDSDPDVIIPPKVQQAINRGSNKDGLIFHTYIESGHIRVLSHLKGQNFDYNNQYYRRQFL